MLPNCAIGVAAALAVWLTPAHFNPASPVATTLVAVPVALACGMMFAMALDSFGLEMSGGTMANLLSQPVPRERIWRIKTALLGLAIAVVWTTLWVTIALHFQAVPKKEPPWNWSAIWMTGCLAAAVYSGGLWSVLLVRQSAVALWITVLVPVGLLTVASRFGGVSAGQFAVFSALYSIAGFWWARRLFLRAEDTRWTGGTIDRAGPSVRG